MKTINSIDSNFCKNIKEPCFNEFITNDIKDLFKDNKCKFYKKNQILFNEKTSPLGIYYLNIGKIKVFKTAINKNEQILRLVSSGDFFGIISVITGENRITSATALEDSYVCFIPKKRFMQRVHENPELSYYFMNCLSQVLKEIENISIITTQKSEKERLAEALLIICKKFESDTILFLKKDLASFTNIAREKLTSYLYKLNERQ